MTVFIASNGVSIRFHSDRINVGGEWIDRMMADALYEFMSGDAAAIKPQPWKMANPGDVWLLTQEKYGGDASPWVKQRNGEWMKVDADGRLNGLTDNHFITGNRLWSA